MDKSAKDFINADGKMFIELKVYENKIIIQMK